MRYFTPIVLLFLAGCAAPQHWVLPPGTTQTDWDRQDDRCNVLADIQANQDSIARMHTIIDCMNGAGYALRNDK